MKKKVTGSKKTLKISLQSASNLRGLDFKIRRAKKIEHASLCADNPTFNSV